MFQWSGKLLLPAPAILSAPLAGPLEASVWRLQRKTGRFGNTHTHKRKSLLRAVERPSVLVMKEESGRRRRCRMCQMDLMQVDTLASKGGKT